MPTGSKKELIEKVAIALSQWRNDTNLGESIWDGLSERFRDAYRAQAKAAIAVINVINEELADALKEHHRIALEYSGDAYAESACREQTEKALARYSAIKN